MHEFIGSFRNTITNSVLSHECITKHAVSWLTVVTSKVVSHEGNILCNVLCVDFTLPGPTLYSLLHLGDLLVVEGLLTRQVVYLSEHCGGTEGRNR